MNTVKNRILYFFLLLPALLFSAVVQENKTAAKTVNEDALAVFYTIDGDVQNKYNAFV